MSVDSAASFQARAKEVGVPEAYIKTLEARKVTTFSAFAFISAYQPSSQDESPFIAALKSYLGEDPKDHLPALRRLFFESPTLAVQDLRDRYEGRSSHEPRKLSMPDRVDRLRKLKRDLPGLTIDSLLEPSHALVDKLVAQAEEQCFTPIPLSACTARESEMRAEKKDPVALRIEGTIRVTKAAALPQADTSAELHVRACMQRRALAMQMAGVASFSVMDSWFTKLFAHMMKPTLSGMKPPNLHQLIDADKTLWMLVAQHTRGETLTAGTVLPIDRAVKTFQDAPDVSFCLLPRLGGGGSKRKASSCSASGDEAEGNRQRKKKRKGKKVKKEDPKKEDPPPPPAPPGQQRPNRLDLPKQARTRDDEKKPLCFGYSTGTCPHQDKEKCSRGHHRCWFCLGSHAGKDCPKKGSNE